MVVGAIGFYRRDLVLLFVALGLMGVHSTLFGPVKYAILPQHLRNDELVGGNGLVEMGTFVAILLGEIVGGLVIAIKPERPDAAPARRAIAVAIAGYLVSRAHPDDAGAWRRTSRINWNPFTETWRNLRFAHGNRVVWLSMLGHLLVLVLRRDVPDAVRQFHQGRAGRRRARRHAAARDLLDRHRRRLAAVRAAVRTQGRARPRAVRLDRPRRCSPIDLWFASRRPARRRASRASAAFLAQPAHWRVVADLDADRACSAASTSCRCTR